MGIVQIKEMDRKQLLWTYQYNKLSSADRQLLKEIARYQAASWIPTISPLYFLQNSFKEAKLLGQTAEDIPESPYRDKSTVEFVSFQTFHWEKVPMTPRELAIAEREFNRLSCCWCGNKCEWPYTLCEVRKHVEPLQILTNASVPLVCEGDPITDYEHWLLETLKIPMDKVFGARLPKGTYSQVHPSKLA